MTTDPIGITQADFGSEFVLDLIRVPPTVTFGKDEGDVLHLLSASHTASLEVAFFKYFQKSVDLCNILLSRWMN